MSLLAANFPIVPTPSGIIDGHFPNGDDGTAAIPLTWRTVDDFTGKQVGSPFSIDLFATYLTQAGGATASLLNGTLTGGWTLASNGTLSYSGVGTGTNTIQVRATIVGQVPSDSSFFTYESIPATANPDVLAPTVPTGLTVVTPTSTSLAVTVDAPMDVITSTIPSSGLKEVRFYLNGAFNGVGAVTGGRSVLLLPADVGGGPVRRWAGGWYTAIDGSQRNAWVNNPVRGGNNGPILFTGSGSSIVNVTNGLNFRHDWKALEPTANHFTLGVLQAEYNACASLGVMYFPMIIGRTFSLNDNPSPGAGQGPNGTDIDLALLTDSYTSQLSGGGFQIRWWNSTVINRFDKLVKAIGALLNDLPYFGGICTQETSVGSPDSSTGYSLAGFQASIIANANSIGAACPNARQVWFFNFIHQGGIKDLGPCAVVVQANGGIVGGPDLVVGGGITTNCYPLYAAIQNGVGTTATGTTGDVSKGFLPLAGKSPTICCLQPAEWQSSVAPGKAPANQPNATILQRCQYGMGIAPYASSSVLRLNAIMPDWHQTATTLPGGTPNEKFNPAISDIAAAHPTFNTFTPPPGMVAGSGTQTGANYNVTGAGTGVGATTDQWSTMRIPSNGNFTIIAKIANITGTDTTQAFGGIGIREDATSASRAASLIVTPTNIQALFRAQVAGTTTTKATVAGQNWTSTKWLRLSRSGTTFAYSWSSNGLGWNSLGNATISMVDAVFADLIACSGIITQITVHFQQVNVQALAPVPYTYSLLSGATPYNLSALSRDQATNDSGLCASLSATTS